MKRATLLPLPLLLLAMATGCSGSGRRDAAITERVLSMMESDPIVRTRDLSVTTSAGVVTLEGEVPDEVAHRRVLEIVRRASSVVQVVDRLRMPPVGLPAEAPVVVPRAVRAALPFPRLEPAPAAAGEAAVPDRAPELVPAGTAEVELAPPAPAAEWRAAAGIEPAPEVDGSIGEAPAAAGPDMLLPAPASGFPATMSEEDAAISVDVHARVEEAVPSGRVQVTTRRGVVTLSGVVDTDLERAQALEAARRAAGVARVEDRLLVLRA